MKRERAGNPFRFGQVVVDDAYCPRPRLERQLQDRLRRGQNTVVMGERRVGKTSLIWKVASSMRGKKLWYVDFLGIKSGEDFLSRCIQGMGELEKHSSLLERLLKAMPRLSVSISPDPVTGLPSLSPSIAPGGFQPDTVSGLFGLVADMASKGKVIAVFDEFQDVASVPGAEALLAVLRGRIQFLGGMPVVFSGSVRNAMWRLFAEDGSPLYKSADFLEVETGDFDDLRGFLRRKFETGKKRISDELLDEVFRITDGVPGDVQQFCAALWEVSPPDAGLTREQIGPALEGIFRNESRSYEAIVIGLPAQQLKVLATLARKGGESPLGKEFLQAAGITQPSSVKRALTMLCKRRLVFRIPKTYRFSNPFLKIWLVHKNY